jgi:DNA primase
MDSVQEIKSRLSIVDVLSGYVQLKKAGRNFKACCPFHNEKTPSFIISPERQFAWCYGCQTGGDIFKVVQLLEGVDFKESLKILADKAGVELPTNFSGGVKKEKKDMLIEINEETRDFFVEELGKNSAAQEYLKGRELSKETIEEWGIGFAPDGFENLFPKLEEKFAKKEIVEAGVAGLKEMGSEKLFDKFRNRIMFPIEDHRGRVVAFTGRVLDDSEPKYMNSPESPIFTKGNILFGFAKAREAMRESKFVVLVEGQLDVISAHQKDFKNVVASSGTALTEMHLKSLKNLVDRVVFCFDGDNAGIDSTTRALEIAVMLDVDAKVAILPDGAKDPDEALQKDPKIFEGVIADAVTPLEFFLRKVFAKVDMNETAEKKKVVRVLLTFAEKITSAVERDDFIRKASAKLGISESVLQEEMDGLPNIPTYQKPADPSTKSAQDKFSSKDFLTGLVVAFPKVAKELDSELEQIGLKEIDVTEKEEKLALLASDKYSDFSDAKIKKEMEGLIAKLDKNSLEETKKELKAKMQQAEEAGDDEKAAELFGEYQKLLGK